MTDFLTLGVTILCIAGLSFLRWVFDKQTNGELWGFRWLLTWWLVGFVQLIGWDIAALGDWIEPALYSNWRRVAFRGLQLVGIVGCCHWVLTRATRD